MVDSLLSVLLSPNTFVVATSPVLELSMVRHRWITHSYAHPHVDTFTQSTLTYAEREKNTLKSNWFVKKELLPHISPHLYLPFSHVCMQLIIRCWKCLTSMAQVAKTKWHLILQRQWNRSREVNGFEFRIRLTLIESSHWKSMRSPVFIGNVLKASLVMGKFKWKLRQK